MTDLLGLRPERAPRQSPERSALASTGALAGRIIGKMQLRQFVIPGLGHISALIADDAAGVAAVVDPRRDVDIYVAEAAEHGLSITHVVETHLHNDYVSGARELAALTGAQHIHSAAADLRYEHRPMRQGDSFDVGALRFGVLETPGHTPEHLSYAVADLSRADDPLILFTGGSLLVGAVGRTDLLGKEHAEPYARLLFSSLHDRLLSHDDGVAVMPTHGGGSLCSKDIASTPWSTIGFERRHQPLLAIEEVGQFVQALLRDQPTFPRYFARMRPTNQAGPMPLGEIPQAKPLPAAEVMRKVAGGALIVDLRSHQEHARGYIPGSMWLPAGSSFGTWLGWVAPHDRPLVLLLGADDEWDDAIRQALRIGYENVTGHLDGGLAAWRAAGGSVERGSSISTDELQRAIVAEPEMLVIDVRQASEYAEGHVPGAIHLNAGDLPDHLSELPMDRPVATVCRSGYRSAVAAGLLRRAGFRDVRAVCGGMPDWASAGYSVERGEPVPA